MTWAADRGARQRARRGGDARLQRSVRDDDARRADRSCAVRVHDAVALWAVEAPAVRAGVGLVFRRRSCGWPRRRDEGRRVPAAAGADCRMRCCVRGVQRARCARGFPAQALALGRGGVAIVAVGFLALAVCACGWFPMLIAVATRDDPALVAYRDEILFQQTVHRYASAWHHVKPWYYFILEVIPGSVAAVQLAAVLAGAALGRRPGVRGTRASGCRWRGCC